MAEFNLQTKVLKAKPYSIEISVGLPLYLSKNSYWIALEGLSNQKELSTNWELIVAEEQINQIGLQNLSYYKKKLVNAGCCQIKYIALDQWVPLSKKWEIMGQMTALTSKVFILQAADDYSDSYRLKNTYDYIVNDNADWVQSKQGLFYNIENQKVVLFDYDSYPKKHITGISLAVKTQYIRSLSNLPEYPKRVVDAWLFRSCQAAKGKNLNVVWNIKSHPYDSLFTNGFNHISTKRGTMMNNPRPPFRQCEVDLSQHFPEDFLKKLINAKSKLQINSVSLGQSGQQLSNVI